MIRIIESNSIDYDKWEKVKELNDHCYIGIDSRNDDPSCEHWYFYVDNVCLFMGTWYDDCFTMHTYGIESHKDLLAELNNSSIEDKNCLRYKDFMNIINEIIESDWYAKNILGE